MFALISDIAAREAHNNGKLTVYLPTRPLNYNVKYSYLFSLAALLHKNLVYL